MSTQQNPSTDREQNDFRNGLPIRMSGWISVKTARLSRKHSRYAKLQGEVFSLHVTEDAPPEDEFDVVGAFVQYNDRSSSRSFRLSIGRRVYTCSLASFEEMSSWAQSIIFASRHSFQSYYTLGPLIAEGAFSRVYQAYALDDATQLFAVKVVKKRSHDTHALEAVRRERHVNCLLDHATVVQAVDMFSNMHSDHLVFEYMQGGTLAKLLLKNRQLGESYARAIMKQVLTSLDYIHSNNIVHRDVRPQNIFLSATKFPMSVALGDFGSSNFISEKYVNPDVLQTMVGIPPYMAVEICRREKYGPLADIWSAGVVLYEMLSGEVPFIGASDYESFQLIKEGRVEFTSPIWKNISDDSKGLIRQMLQPDTYKRISALAALQHRWFTNVSKLSSVSSKTLAIAKSIGLFGEKDSGESMSMDTDSGRKLRSSNGSMSNVSAETSDYSTTDTILPDRSESSENHGSLLGHNRSQVMPWSMRSMPQTYSMNSVSGQGTIRVTRSVRAIAERGLQRVVSDNPARMRHLLSSPIVQRQLSLAFTYRRRLIVIAKAFVGVFRMRALASGHSATRQLSMMEHAGIDDVNAIVDKRKEALEQSRQPEMKAAVHADRKQKKSHRESLWNS